MCEDMSTLATRILCTPWGGQRMVAMVAILLIIASFNCIMPDGDVFAALILGVLIDVLIFCGIEI